MTFAMFLAQKGIIPPKIWIHDANLKDKCGFTVCQYLQYNCLPVPNEWYDQNYKNVAKNSQQMQNAIYAFIPGSRALQDVDITQNVQVQNCDGFTIPMIFATQGYICQQLIHNPNIQNKYQYTVAMYLAQNGINPPEQWIHSALLKNNNNQTVAMLLAQKQIIPDTIWNHYPEISDKQNNTVALFLSQKGIIPDKKWLHNPNIHNMNGEYVALNLAQNGIIPSKEWQIDPLTTDKFKNTVGIILSHKGIVPPKNWLHDIDKLNSFGQSIRINLYQNNHICFSNTFININNFKGFIEMEDICNICEKYGLQTFVITNCDDNICQSCFYKLVTQKNYMICPICKQLDWTIDNSEDLKQYL